MLVVKTQINQLLMVVILCNIVAAIGCHRGYYRRQADAEARRLIREKSLDPRWDSADGAIDIDPQSRMFNPFSKDHPPIPPDDAASHQFMHRVDGKEGYPHWHANGDTNHVEAPEWLKYLPLNEKGQCVLDLDRAFDLALMHSPDLQQQRERLYLAALEVSIERFGFDSQLFTGFNSFFTSQGRLRGGTSGTSSSTFQSQIGSNGGGLNIRRLGITGANFAVGLANTILFEFAGNNTRSASSLIDFSIIQPLLRGAGRDRIMESLTQSERDLLASVRQLERFRRGFYLQVAIGRNPGAGVSGALLNAPGLASANAGGFFGLLEDQQRIRNQEFNVRQLEAVLKQFREFFARERLDAVQLKLFETSVYSQQRSLLDAKTQYQTSLDQFKIELGLPPDLEVVIEDSYLDQFELISDQVNLRLIAISDLREETGNALNQVDNLFADRDEKGFDWNEFKWPGNLTSELENLIPYIDKAEETLKKIVEIDRAQLESDFKRLDSKREARLAYLETVQASIDSGRVISSVDDKLFEPESIPKLDNLSKRLTDPELDNREFIINEDGEKEVPPRSILKRAEILKADFEAVTKKINDFKKAQQEMKRVPGEGELDPELYNYILTEFQQTIPGQLSELNNLMLEISLLQALARSNSIEINNSTIDAELAMRIARCMRRDLMNARAALVDQWRNIEFVADQLEAQVDLVFEGDIGNFGDNPFKIRYETGQLRAGFRFDAPIVRMAERNAYRNALIAYQQARRNYYQFEDRMKQNLRNIVRNIDRNKVLFELDRRTVQVQIENVEINRFELEAPVAANQNARLGTQTARNLADSIIGLNNAQNSFLSSWVQFEVLRRNLDFDLGTMQLDESGRWIDPGVIDESIGIRSAAMFGIELDCQFCEDIGTSYSEIPGGSVMDATDDDYFGRELRRESVPEQPELEPINSRDELSPEVEGKLDQLENLNNLLDLELKNGDTSWSRPEIKRNQKTGFEDSDIWNVPSLPDRIAAQKANAIRAEPEQAAGIKTVQAPTLLGRASKVETDISADDQKIRAVNFEASLENGLGSFDALALPAVQPKKAPQQNESTSIFHPIDPNKVLGQGNYPNR
jgi:outer membrane protein TolC